MPRENIEMPRENRCLERIDEENRCLERIDA